jgi:hypothetical protein
VSPPDGPRPPQQDDRHRRRLLERHRITPAEAAQMLADLAQARGLSLLDAAEWLILTRTRQ